MKRGKKWKLPPHESVFNPKRFRRMLRKLIEVHKAIKKERSNYTMPSMDEMEQQARELM